MALKLSILQGSNLNKFFGAENVSDVYVKIARYSGEETICRFIIDFYNFQIDENGNREKLNFPENIYSFQVNENEDENDYNVRKQGYEYLKTLPEFAGCEDC